MAEWTRIRPLVIRWLRNTDDGVRSEVLSGFRGQVLHLLIADKLCMNWTLEAFLSHVLELQFHDSSVDGWD